MNGWRGLYINIMTYTAPEINDNLSRIVMGCVSRVTGVPSGEFFMKTRKREVVQAKRIYIYEMVRRFESSPSALERLHAGGSGNDHANILRHVRVCDEEMELYPNIRHTVHEIEIMIDRELEKLTLKRGRGKSWTITRKNHRHQSFVTMRLGSRM